MIVRQLMLATTAALLASPLAAQSDGARPSPWEFYHGCWSTSANGAVGPMVCVVPDSAPHRVEMLSVADDVIVSRFKIDADGLPHAYARGGCGGVERASWSPDGQRLYLRAEYHCRKGLGQRVTSSSVLSQTRPDAFTFIERATSDKAAQPVITHFIVQLDTTAFPAEVKRRLSSYRTLTMQTAELEVVHGLGDSTVAEVAREVDLAVADALLRDRGQETYVDRLRVMRGDAALPSVWPSGTDAFVGIGGRRRMSWSGFTSDGQTTGPQSTFQGGFINSQSFYEGNTSWSTSSYMATVAARGAH